MRRVHERATPPDRDRASISSPRPFPKRSISMPCDVHSNMPTERELTAMRNSAVSSTGSEPSTSMDGTEPGISTHFLKVKSKHRGKTCRLLEAHDRKSARKVIIKTFSKYGMTEALRERMERERDALKAAEAASVPNVIRLLRVFEDDDSHYTVIEHSVGETLIELIANHGGKISEQRCRQCVARPALEALAGLHSLGIVHRHLKPEHIIISKTTEHGHKLRIIDFLDSANKAKHPLSSRVGEMPYMAPEVLAAPITEEIFHQVLISGMDERDLPQYDEKADIWSLGAIIFESLSGQQPFIGDSPSEILQLAQSMVSDMDENGVPLFIASNPRLGTASAQFIRDILVLDAAKRPSAHELLSHPWLSLARESVKALQ